MAAFHLIIYGRFWVITEGTGAFGSLDEQGCNFAMSHLLRPGERLCPRFGIFFLGNMATGYH